jgi:hypothetical protein
MAKHVVLERLNQLVAKGYIVRWGGSEQDTLRLEHPRAPDLTLFSDGRIWILTPPPDDWIAAENGTDQRRFQSFVSPNDWIGTDTQADQRRFKAFVARVPKPTGLQRFEAMTAEPVLKKVIVWVLVAFFALVIALLFSSVW